jgi:nucleotide-binding universal stress UspA family protein/quercetin dioxygenase-like cupin family protein
MTGIQTILHPTDFSANSEPAFQTACALARDSRATLLLLHVMMPSESPLYAGTPPDPMRPLESQQSRAQLPWPQPSDPTIRVEHRLAEGTAAEEILRLAESLRCDLIVMGTHGRTGLGRFLTGSVTEEVLRTARCPVMVVKTPLGVKHDTEAEAVASHGEPVDVRPLGTLLDSAHTRTLMRTTAVEITRLIVRAGQEAPARADKGEIVIQCLEGSVACASLGKKIVLDAGRLVDLPAGETYSLNGIEDASVLLTILAPRQ